MTVPPRVSETGVARPLGTAELAAFSNIGASSIADELRAALAPGIQLLRPLGAGAMGLVFLGRDPLLKRLVAVKVLAPHLAGDEIARGRFVRESEASAAVMHPNVAGIYLVGELPTSKTPYYVMQFIDGRSLAEDIAAGVVTSELRAKRLIGEIASALEAAHARGLVHRDVKPANIMIENATDRPIVLDFGISAVLQREGAGGDSRLTTAGTYVGTPTYMSPEQATGEPVTGKSDVYGLGLIAFELLSGKPPFDGPPVVVMAAHVERPAPSLHSVRPGIDEHLADLVDRCLRKNAADRPTASDVAHSLVPGTRSLLEWPPPGLEALRGRGARLAWRWTSVCVVALLFFAFLHVRPTLGSPRWAEGEQSSFWSRLMTPTDAVFSDATDRRAVATDALPADATSVWMFLVSVSVGLLMIGVLIAVWYTALLARDARRAARDGYPWPVVFDVAWDRYDDTDTLLNGSGVYALLDAEQRTELLRARRWHAVVSVIMVALGVLAPLLWLVGALRVRGNPRSEIVTLLEFVLMALPLFMGIIALGVLNGRTRLATVKRRRSNADGTPMQADLVTAWLSVAGRGARTPSRFGRGRLAVLGSVAAAIVLLVLTYVVVVVFIVVFVSTTRLVAGRAKAEQWRTSFLVDSTRPMRFSELDTLARRSSIPAQGTQPDMEAAHLIVARSYLRANSQPVPPALAADIEGGRAVSPDVAAADETPSSVLRILADSVLPTEPQLRTLEAYAQSPWLPVWRRFAASPDYPVMWQYRPGLPGVKYLWSVPIMRFAGMKDLAYRNSMAGLLALSKGDVATATLRGRENVAAGRHILNGATLLDNLIGLVVIDIGRGALGVVARTTGDKALAEEVARLRATGIRWRTQRISSVGLIAMTADPESREAFRYVKQLESPPHFGELMITALVGFCANARELLFGSDSARANLLHDIAKASGNPRAPELEALGNRWLSDLRAGTLDRSGETPEQRRRTFSTLAPLGWIGMRGFRDRARVCLSGGWN